MNRPRIGVPVDTGYVGASPVHFVVEKYLGALADGAQSIPLILPARAKGAEQPSLENQISAREQLEGLDGLFLTGSPANIEPWRYGSETPMTGKPDPQRDANAFPLLKAAFAMKMPVFAICRGFQELNVACGGTLCTAIQDVPGMMDHREDSTAPREVQYAPAHSLKLVQGEWLAALLGKQQIRVNSLHGQGIDRLGGSLVALAHSEDGLIEAVRHRYYPFVIGVQWHPEWRYADNPVSMALFEAFGKAAREFSWEW